MLSCIIYHVFFLFFRRVAQNQLAREGQLGHFDAGQSALLQAPKCGGATSYTPQISQNMVSTFVFFVPKLHS
jgi:hypothetical protein